MIVPETFAKKAWAVRSASDMLSAAEAAACAAEERLSEARTKLEMAQADFREYVDYEAKHT